MMTHKYDSDIVDVVHKIMGSGTMEVETINESLLVKLFELGGTPLPIKSSVRDIEADWNRESAYGDNSQNPKQ